jgi:ADP-ribosylglycohydrolase
LENVNKAMLLKGGGPMALGPGQVTDDSELAWCLACGLRESEGKLNLKNIVKYFGMWMNSPPFGIEHMIIV